MPFGVKPRKHLDTDQKIQTQLLTPIRKIYGKHVFHYELFNVVNVVAITLRYLD